MEINEIEYKQQGTTFTTKILLDKTVLSVKRLTVLNKYLFI